MAATPPPPEWVKVMHDVEDADAHDVPQHPQAHAGASSGQRDDVALDRGHGRSYHYHETPRPAGGNSLFTDDVETASSHVVSRGTGYYAYGRPRQTPRSPYPAAAADHDGASPARSVSQFTSVTDRIPPWASDPHRGSGGGAALRNNNPRDDAAEFDHHRHDQHRYHQHQQQQQHRQLDSWCQTSDHPEALTRSEAMAARQRNRDAWIEDFKRQWLSVSTHYGRLINRAERCTPSRSRLAPSGAMNNLTAAELSALDGSTPAPHPATLNETEESTPSTSRRFDARFVAAARASAGLVGDEATTSSIMEGQPSCAHAATLI